QFHWIAGALVALGAAVQAERLRGRHARGAVRLVRGLVAALGAATVIAAIGVISADPIREWSALRRLPAPQRGLPNVLLLILHHVRARTPSLVGYARPTTPHLEEWARKGAVFSNAFATSSWTLTSHSSMFTGRYPYELSADWTKPLQGTRTLAEA